MATAFRRCVVVLAIACFAAGSAFSQSSTQANQFGFKMGLGVGVQSFNDNPPASPVQYQDLAFTPEFSFGPFGIGLAVQLDYTFSGTDNSFQVRQADWVPTGDVTFGSIMALYLPKIMYVRWGETTDPLYVKFGSFTDGTLGDGWIMGSYDNTLFLPTNRHFGLEASLDGSLFKFPFVGVQTVVGNIAAFDVLGGRAYVRPLVSTSIPILNNIEVGFTGVVDTNPYLGTSSEGTVTVTPVSVLGADVRLPIVYVKDVVSLLAFTDVAAIQGTSWGGMMGVGGKLINIFTYGLQLRALGVNFIPDYFGPTYDLLRDQQYNIVTSSTPSSDNMLGWQASIGTSFLNDKIIFNVSLDGPFAPSAAFTTSSLSYPHLRGILSLAEGVVPGITFDFSYDKKDIQSFADLVSAQDAAIQAQVNFQSGPAVISFVYKIVYDPTQTPNPWTVTSGLQSSISLF